MERVDCVVIGAGVVGLAIAKHLAERGREVIVLEAESAIGTGTSSRNSEVIHAGIYYPPGSLKAVLCRRGRDLLYRYCAERHIPHARCGKLIVAASPDQRPRLDALKANAGANEVADLRLIERAELAELEPAICADNALLSPSTGIVDSHALMLALQGDLEQAGGMVAFRSAVRAGRVASDGIELDIGGDDPMRLHAKRVVNAAGLAAQTIAQSIDGVPAATIDPAFLAVGHYYAYGGRSPFRHLIYPLPEDGGLGVHATLDLGGQVKFGPDVRWIDRIDYRFDDSRRAGFIDAIRRYYPAVEPDRLQPGYTGIRPKISGAGQPAGDFRLIGPDRHGIPGLVNLFGIESPGLTAALAIGEMVAAGLTAAPIAPGSGS